MLRQIIGDLEPGGFARHVEVAFGTYAWVIIETAKSNSEFRGALGAVYNRRTTDTAKTPVKSRRGFKVCYKILSLYPLEVFDADARTAAKGSAMGLSAV